MDYAGPGWQPWLSSTQMDRLDRAQNKCSTPIEAVHLEANVQSYQTTSRRLTAISWEKAKRAPKNHPREVASRPGPPHRLARSNWREQAKRTADQLPEELENREVLSVEAPPPWIEERQRWTAFPKPMGENRSDNSVEKAVNTINDNCPEFVIYTDGSAAEGTRDGGSAVVVTTGDPREPEVVQAIKIRGRTLTSS